MEMTGTATSGSLGAHRERFAPAADPALRQLNQRRRATASIARTLPSAQSRRSKVDNLSLYLAYYMILTATATNL
ncbi:hypothetical protein OPV22_008624 [Ensete ventricosum]|uniref:BHLH domain-containing protein n=1 Tax=Ensete ventricosum TaxID=4639 RepID=A0AAV8RCN9_ENSVE|nr:hypothetical protein OPV22_008624 [Ensete ventricosum]